MLGLDEENLRALERPSRRDLIYAILGFVLGVVLLPVELARLYGGFRDGQLLVSNLSDPGWNVEWASSPVGFAAVLVLHVAITAFAIVLIWYGVATVRHWLLER